MANCKNTTLGSNCLEPSSYKNCKPWDMAQQPKTNCYADSLAQEALAIAGTDIRLFGKPESFVKRRMGVALARAADVDTARTNAKLAASRVRPRLP